MNQDTIRTIDPGKLSTTECAGIQINGLQHCSNINCKWQGLSACQGKHIIETGFNALGYRIGTHGLAGDK
jgi:hypothetical protein